MIPNIHKCYILPFKSKPQNKNGITPFPKPSTNVPNKISLIIALFQKNSNSNLQQPFYSYSKAPKIFLASISSQKPQNGLYSKTSQNEHKKMETTKTSPPIREQLPGFVTLYENGKIQREEIPNGLTTKLPSNPDSFQHGISTTDIALDSTTGLWARVFLPEVEEESGTSQPKKLPVVLYFHGGGFCTGDPSWQMFHALCSRLSIATRSIWVSVAYRLAPEHRLPAGCEDCIAALSLVEQPGLEPLCSRGDTELCFLAGDSVGANLAHQVAISAAQRGRKNILGMILMHPGFVREERSRSEVENGPDLALVSIDAVDKGSRLCLPEGENKDYYLMNPWIPSVGELLLPPVIVFVGNMDIFYDRQIEYCRGMRGVGQDLEIVEYAEMGHCFFNYPQNENCPEGKDLVERVVRFVERCRLQAGSCRRIYGGSADAI